MVIRILLTRTLGKSLEGRLQGSALEESGERVGHTRSADEGVRTEGLSRLTGELLISVWILNSIFYALCHRFQKHLTIYSDMIQYSCFGSNTQAVEVPFTAGL